jgi:hypothetical protein
MVTSAVSSVIGWALGPVAGLAAPTTPVGPPLAWTLLAFARREIDNFVSVVTGVIGNTVAAIQTTSLALTGFAPLAAVAAAVNVPGVPLPGAQVSPSTQFVNWVTGNYQTGDPLMANTLARFGIDGTDVGVSWDNGMVDDPTTPYNEHQILMAFGDTFSGPDMTGVWRFNTLLRSADTNLAKRNRSAERRVVQRQHVRRSTVEQADIRQADRQPRRRAADRSHPDSDGRHFDSDARHPVRRDPVPQLHVGVAVGRRWFVDHQLLRDRLLDRQRRELDGRTHLRPVQPAMER